MGLFSNMSDVKRALKIYEAHRCSKCGEVNAAKHKIILQYRYDEIGLSRSALERNQAAEQRLDEEERHINERLKDSGDIAKYYDLNLLGKCKHCGHMEPWSRMQSRALELIFNVLIVLSVMTALVGVVGLFMGGSIAMVLAAVGVILATVAVKLFGTSRRKKRERQIAALQAQYIPYLTTNKDDFCEHYPELDFEQLVTVEPTGYYKVDEY